MCSASGSHFFVFFLAQFTTLTMLDSPYLSDICTSCFIPTLSILRWALPLSLPGWIHASKHLKSILSVTSLARPSPKLYSPSSTPVAVDNKTVPRWKDCPGQREPGRESVERYVQEPVLTRAPFLFLLQHTPFCIKCVLHCGRIGSFHGTYFHHEIEGVTKM